MIKECYRVLKPGGVIRISTPDIHKYINITLSKDPFDIKVANTFTDQWIRPGFHNAKNYVPPKDYSNPIFFLNDIFLNYDHKFIYDFDTLKLLLEEHSFTSVEKGVAGISKFAALHNKETHTDEANTYITLTVEGRKP
jgi:SAM-dependent methyltransferase